MAIKSDGLTSLAIFKTRCPVDCLAVSFPRLADLKYFPEGEWDHQLLPLLKSVRRLCIGKKPMYLVNVTERLPPLTHLWFFDLYYNGHNNDFDDDAGSLESYKALSVLLADSLRVLVIEKAGQLYLGGKAIVRRSNNVLPTSFNGQYQRREAMMKTSWNEV